MNQNILKLLGVSASVMTIFVFLFYFYHFQGVMSLKHEHWGTFGDFIGGTLNPILSFLAFIALLTTIKLQSEQLRISSEELKFSREELQKSANALTEQSQHIKKQNFENTFFNMLDLYNNITNNLEDAHNEIMMKGKQAFYSMAQRTNNKSTFNSIIDRPASQLNFYFRNIYQILKFIELSDISNQKFYSNLLRAQLSQAELKLLFYNCITIHGKEKTKPLIEKYQFLEPLKIGASFSYEDIFEYDKNVYGDNKESLIYLNKLEARKNIF